MKRSFHQFRCQEDILAGTLDEGPLSTGLLIISGGNEIRSGSHSGMAKLARHIAAQGYPVFRYDRRGIGDSSGTNRGFLETQDDIRAALACFQEANPHIQKSVAFGNCDAASALALFGADMPLDSLILANPWVIEEPAIAAGAPAAPPASAIRSRYWQRLKNPKSLIDLLTGKINLRKLAKGLKQATQKQENTALSIQFRDGLARLDKPCRIILASRDTTALSFLAAWNSKDFADARALPHITTETRDTASHSFADNSSKRWLEEQLLEVLKHA